VVIDNSITFGQAKTLSEQAEDRLIKCVFLFLERAFETNGRFYLHMTILPDEEPRFKSKYLSQFPEQKLDFERVFINRLPNELTPFFLGLTAYEEEYISISDFVGSRIKRATEPQKKLVSYVALSSYYGKGKNKELPSYMFMKLLNVPEDYCILQHWVAPQVLDLLIDTQDLRLKALHPIIEKEILDQLIGTNVRGELNLDIFSEFI